MKAPIFSEGSMQAGWIAASIAAQKQKPADWRVMQAATIDCAISGGADDQPGRYGYSRAGDHASRHKYGGSAHSAPD